MANPRERQTQEPTFNIGPWGIQTEEQTQEKS